MVPQALSSNHCKNCGDSEYILRNGSVVPCECLHRRHRDEYSKSIIPPKYVNNRLSAISPYAGISKNISTERQKRVIDLLKVNPLAGYLFLGPTNVGKTHLLYTLANEAIYAGRHVVASSASQIIKSAREAEFNKEEASVIDRDIILQHEFTHIFIDELDKLKLSEWVQLLLFDLIVLAHDYSDRVKISVTSNLPPKSFEDNYGAAFYRKLTEISKLIVYGGC